MRKIAALFNEFRETGAAEMLGYKTPADLRAGYPNFFWNMVTPFVQDALKLLRVTQPADGNTIYISPIMENLLADDAISEDNSFDEDLRADLAEEAPGGAQELV